MSKKTAKRILITGSGGPLGCNVTRSLKKAPEPLWIVGTEANHYHVHLSLTDKTVLIPSSKNRDAYVKAMQKVIADEGVNMILPTHPAEVRMITTYRQEFGAVKLLLPPIEVVNCADSKWQTHGLLNRAGIPVPQTFHIDTPADLEAAFAAIKTRPIWVRGSGTPGAGIGVASLPCKEVAHAKGWIDYWNGWGNFIASEFLPGRNLTWCSIFKDGVLVAAQARERLEYVLPHVSPSGITGAPAVSKTVSRSDVRDYSEAAVRQLMPKPHGTFFVDLKEDGKGVPRITEINAGRFGTTIHFYTEAGFNFPYMLVQLAFDEAVPGAPLINPIPDETFWIRTLDCGPVLVRNVDNGR